MLLMGRYRFLVKVFGVRPIIVCSTGDPVIRYTTPEIKQVCATVVSAYLYDLCWHKVKISIDGNLKYRTYLLHPVKLRKLSESQVVMSKAIECRLVDCQIMEEICPKLFGMYSPSFNYVAPRVRIRYHKRHAYTMAF